MFSSCFFTFSIKLVKNMFSVFLILKFMFFTFINQTARNNNDDTALMACTRQLLYARRYLH